MTGFNNNIKFVPVAPKTYEVRYVENKQSGLSPAARNKVISRSGSNYLSERVGEINPGYGPVTNGQNCKKEARFEVNTILTNENYFLAYDLDNSLRLHAVFLVASGKTKDQDFSAIQRRIDEFKSGRLKVYKYKDSSRNKDSVERTEECIKYEAYFEIGLENAIKELKKAPHYDDYVQRYNLSKP